jgi:hypothetical protein
MRIIPAVVLSGLLTAATLFATAAPAGAAPTVCTSEHEGETFPGGIVVPAGATCRLSGSEVDGNVVVSPGATFGTFRSRITGGVTATDASVTLFLTRVGGAIVVRGAAGAVSGLVCFSTVGGSVVVRNARPGEDGSSFTMGGRGLGCGGNTIGGSLILENNRISLVVARNRIGGGLNCFGNTDLVTSGNDVAGATLGQCRNG